MCQGDAELHVARLAVVGKFLNRDCRHVEERSNAEYLAPVPHRPPDIADHISVLPYGAKNPAHPNAFRNSLGYSSTRPPSTTRWLPLTNDARGETIQAIASAISPGRADRFTSAIEFDPLPCRGIGQTAPRHLGDGCAGQHNIDRDATACEFAGRRLGQSEYGAFAGRVGGRARNPPPRIPEMLAMVQTRPP